MATSDGGKLLTVPMLTPGQAWAAAIVLPLLSIILTIMRWHKRLTSKASLGLDDLLLLPALVCQEMQLCWICTNASAVDTYWYECMFDNR